MSQSVARAGGWPGAVVALVAALGAGCPGGKDGGETAETAECVPGYGTLRLSFVMADAYSESVRDEFDGQMVLSIYHVEQEIESCQDYDYLYYEDVGGLTTSLDLDMDFQVQTGQTCANVYGTYYVDDDYLINCEGDLELTDVAECRRVETTISVTCALYKRPDGEG
jgi:hypothetical protein